jgi:hypothetical protein
MGLPIEFKQGRAGEGKNRHSCLLRVWYLSRDRASKEDESRQQRLHPGWRCIQVAPLPFCPSMTLSASGCDRAISGRRNEAERLFCQREGFRRIFFCFEKLDDGIDSQRQRSFRTPVNHWPCGSSSPHILNILFLWLRIKKMMQLLQDTQRFKGIKSQPLALIASLLKHELIQISPTLRITPSGLDSLQNMRVGI